MQTKVIREILIVGIIAAILTLWETGADVVNILETSQTPLEDVTEWASNFGVAALLSAARASIAAVVARVMQALPVT